MANTTAKTKSKRKSVSQHGIPNKKKKTAIEEHSVKNSLNDGSGDNFLVKIREKFEEDLKCNICTEIYIRPTILNCSHMFCEYCITKWKKQQERCPICRDRIESQIRVLCLDVFIEKALEVITPEETKARVAMISQRERKNLEEREDDSEEEEAEENTFSEDSTFMEISAYMEDSSVMGDSSDDDLFLSDESSVDFLLSESYSEDSPEDFSDESYSLTDSSNEDSDCNPGG